MMGTNKGYTGQYQDATGLDYYNARYYDSVIGRFVSADSVQGNTSGMDPYDYVGGNPETMTDPTGQRSVRGDGSTYDNGGYTAPPPATGCAATGDCRDTGSTVPGLVGCAATGDCNTATYEPNPPRKPYCNPSGCYNEYGASTTYYTNSPTSGSSGQQQQGHTQTKKGTSGCSGTNVAGLCVRDMGKFVQGSAEVLGSLATLAAAAIGMFQTGGALFMIAQAFQLLSSYLLLVMKNGISNILTSLDGSPSKGFKIFLDAIQFASDLVATAITIVGLVKNLRAINKYPGNTFGSSWRGFWKVNQTYINKKVVNAATGLAVQTVGNIGNSIFGSDVIWNDGEQLVTDINSN